MYVTFTGRLGRRIAMTVTIVSRGLIITARGLARVWGKETIVILLRSYLAWLCYWFLQKYKLSLFSVGEF